MRKLVVYNHGKDSIPWGEKALALAGVAADKGYEFISPDYRPSNDPDQRVDHLLSLSLGVYDDLILVGSSMGAYVATLASPSLKPRAMLLIAPAFYLPNYRQQTFQPFASRIEVFHGWQDHVVPPENTWRFCRDHRANLHMVDADHRLLSILPSMCDTFQTLLL